MLIYTNQFVWSLDTLKVYYFKEGTIYYLKILLLLIFREILIVGLRHYLVIIFINEQVLEEYKQVGTSEGMFSVPDLYVQPKKGKLKF